MKITVVSGPPCSGKTHHIDTHRQPGDVVLDLDQLAHALGYPDPHLDWNTTHPAKAIALRARASALKAIRSLDVDATAWIIDTAGVLELPDTAELIALDPGPEECHRRAQASARPESTHQQIDNWYGIAVTSRDW